MKNIITTCALVITVASFGTMAFANGDTHVEYPRKLTEEQCQKAVPAGMTLEQASKKVDEVRRAHCGTDNYSPWHCQHELTTWGTVQRCLMLGLVK